MQYRHATIWLLLSAPLLLAACGGGKGGDSAGASATAAASTALGTVSLMAAGANHSVAVGPAGVASGPAYLWGDNTLGQIGAGTQLTPATAPVVLKSSTLPASTQWKAVAAGGAHTLAIRSDGTLWAWGLNFNGQLGDGNSNPARTVTAPEKIGNLTSWQAVAAGDAHSVALEGSGRTQIWAWGQNSLGQLGLSKTLIEFNIADALIPTKLTNAVLLVGGLKAIPFTSPTGLYWKSVGAGGSHNLALRSDGLVFSWGNSANGRLGQSVVTNNTIATQIAPLGSGSVSVASIATGRDHSLAIDSFGQLFAWGANASGQLGDGSQIDRLAPIQVGTDTDWFVMAGGGAHTLAIKRDRTLWAWGSNSDGQLGDGSTLDALTPKRIGTASNWDVVAAGRNHSMAIDTDGKLWVWGRNAEGQLGLGNTTGPVLAPTLLP